MPFIDKIAYALRRLQVLFSLRTNIVFLSLEEVFHSTVFKRLAHLQD